MILFLLALSAVDYADVAPLLHTKCAPCHRPGEVAPFPLLTHADVSKHATQISTVLEQGIMPPWKAVHGDFAGSRALDAKDRKLLLRWLRSGAPLGQKPEPEGPKFREGWQLGEPDLVLEMPRAFDVPADGGDLYQCFVIPVAVARYVRAWEFQPGARKAVHHALFFTDGSKGARKRAEAGGGTYSCFGVPGFVPSGSLGGWSPGFAAFESPEGTASRLQAGHDLVMQIHYHPTGKPETDRSRIGLYFATKPPVRKIMDVGLVSRMIDIPAGEAAYKVRDHFTLPIDVEVTGVIPHAHYICRRMLGWAVLPNGRKKILIEIGDWDFNWQEQYRYRKPFVLPAGTRVEMEFTYDNSGANPRNPSRPPKRVEWGPDTTDEMAGLHIQVIPVRAEETSELGKALWGKIMRSVGGRF